MPGAEPVDSEALNAELAAIGGDGELSPDQPAAPPAHYWTRRLLSAGFSVEECAAIRRLPREVIRDHARRSEDEG